LLKEVAMAGGKDHAFHIFFIFFGICLVEEDSAAIAASVFGVVESFVGSGEERTCDFAGGGLGEANADGKGYVRIWYGKLAYRLFDPGGDDEGIRASGVGKDEEKFVAAEAA
jgi:hypothetical protein